MKVDIHMGKQLITFKASEKNSKNVNYNNLLPYFLWSSSPSIQSHNQYWKMDCLQKLFLLWLYASIVHSVMAGKYVMAILNKI